MSGFRHAEALLDPAALSVEAIHLAEIDILARPAKQSVDAQVLTALSVEHVSLAFGGVRALADVSLEVQPGEIHAVIGPNGAGKSSLLNVISGLYRPDSGRVSFSGAAFSHVPTSRLARLGVARTFQNLALFKGLSVIDNIVMGLSERVRSLFIEQIVGTPRARREAAEHRSEAEAIAAFFHLTQIRDRVAGDLPYGIQKRVELARALVGHPRLLLLDEPMAGMTLTEKQELSLFIRDARDAYGTSIVLIEHDIGIVTELSDRIAVLDYGRKIADGTPDEIQADPDVIDAYLGIAHDDEDGDGL